MTSTIFTALVVADPQATAPGSATHQRRAARFGRVHAASRFDWHSTPGVSMLRVCVHFGKRPSLRRLGSIGHFLQTQITELSLVYTALHTIVHTALRQRTKVRPFMFGCRESAADESDAMRLFLYTAVRRAERPLGARLASPACFEYHADASTAQSGS